MTKNAPAAIVSVYRKDCSIPDTLRVFAIFPYGYPDEERKQQDRFDAGRIHYV